MDDDRHLVEEKDQRLRLGIGVIAGILVLVLVVIRFGSATPEPDEVPTAVQRALDNHARHAAQDTPELPIAGAPIEFELVVGDKPYDIIPNRAIELLPEVALEIEATATWTANGNGFHFRHASTVSVVASAEMAIAAQDGDVVQIIPVDAALTDADARERLAAQKLTGGVPASRLIAGEMRSGVRHDTATGLTLELYLVPLAKQRVGVLLFRREPDAGLGAFAELLASLAPGAGDPSPHFALHGTQLFVDQPARLADPPVTVTVRRRKAIVRTIDSTTSTKYPGLLTFEHPPGFAVARVPNPAMLAVSIQHPKVGVQLVHLPLRISIDELRSSLLGPLRLRDLGEVVRGAGARAVRGRKLALESAPVHTEIYMLERGTKSIGVMVQYHADDAAIAGELATPVIMSVQ